MMATINKIRLTNVVYEDGDKRFNDETFNFNGNNSAMLLENGGGKTVLIHTMLQAVLPHTDLGERKIKDTLQLENAPAHIGIEWIINEHPRRYVATVVTLFTQDNQLHSYKFVNEYEEGSKDHLDNMPFVQETAHGKRPSAKEEMADYFGGMRRQSLYAKTFDTNKSFHEHIEKNYQIITNEWQSIVKINRDEGGIDQFFNRCKTTTDLFDRLLIPTVEDSIAGHEAGQFANIFEERRDGFRMYHNFKQSMKEYELIQQKIATYVNQFAVYSEKEQAYETAKQQAKGIALLLEKQKKAINEAKESEEENLEKWHKQDRLLQMQQASYDILKEKAEQAALEKTYLDKSGAYETAKETYAKNEHKRYNLLYAKEQAALAVYRQKKAEYERMLAEKDEAGNVEDLQVSLEQVNEHIHGYFTTQLETIDKNIQSLEIEQRPLVEMRTNIAEKTERKFREKQETNQLFHETQGNINSHQEQIDYFKQRILANPSQEDVYTESEQWKVDYRQLEDRMNEATNLVHRKNKEKADVTAALNEAQEQLQTNRLNLQQQAHEQQLLTDAHEQTVAKLTKVRPQWRGLDDLYLKESSIKSTLFDLEQAKTKAREEVLLKERLAHRFTDDYSAQTHFFTDPLLSEKIADWQDNFYVETGTAYIDSLEESIKHSASKYHLWPLTVVTTSMFKSKLQENIMTIKDQLQHPVSIITIEQAKEISAQGATDEKWITPTHWETNLDLKTFENWKSRMCEQAERATVERQAADREIEQVRQVIDEVTQFFKQFSSETKESLDETVNDLRQQETTIKRTIETLKTTHKQIIQDITHTEQDINDTKDKLLGMEKRIETAHDILNLERTVRTLKDKQTERQEKIVTYEQSIKTLERSKNRYNTDIEILQEQMEENRRQKHRIFDQELYEQVKDHRPKFIDESLELLRERRENIQLEIRGIEKEYGEIRAQLENTIKDIARTEQAMVDITESHKNIDETLTFPVDGDSRLARLRKDLQQGKIEIEQLNNEQNAAQSAYDRQLGLVTGKMGDFERAFPNEGLYEFTIPIEKVADYLLEEQQSLTERKKYTQKTLRRIEKEQQTIETAYRKLENFKEAHYFHQTNVTPIHLTSTEQTDFQYNRQKVVETITQTLTDNLYALNKEQEHINRAKNQFRSFCRQHITDRQLQETAVEGMETKETYDEILAYQENMFIRLENANRIARDYISSNDQQIQAFITNIHNHLMNVTDELRVIPKKTRVRVSDKNRYIYQFNIPEWEEEIGKSRIREHIEWILTRLESDHFKKEDGSEDTGKVRKQIETWLQTKSLLQVVMQNEKMRVSCRKVTNDNQISSRLSSWEQSNQWSGGEKWSKNMTLFLGILNFVSEKKQHIQRTMKRHRSVILDNPFGKASSDHVLSPVFFIAEQLGFQIIALTAHADGKFLQDYFPIIYSLKLREAAEQGKQVMTKKRDLNYAYFEDHAPEELSRLEKREQLQLF